MNFTFTALDKNFLLIAATSLCVLIGVASIGYFFGLSDDETAFLSVLCFIGFSLIYKLYQIKKEKKTTAKAIIKEWNKKIYKVSEILYIKMRTLGILLFLITAILLCVLLLGGFTWLVVSLGPLWLIVIILALILMVLLKFKIKT